MENCRNLPLELKQLSNQILWTFLVLDLMKLTFIQWTKRILHIGLEQTSEEILELQEQKTSLDQVHMIMAVTWLLVRVFR